MPDVDDEDLTADSIDLGAVLRTFGLPGIGATLTVGTLGGDVATGTLERVVVTRQFVEAVVVKLDAPGGRQSLTGSMAVIPWHAVSIVITPPPEA